MYVPAHFAVEDLRQVEEFVDRAGAAELVTFDGSRLVATLLPVIWERVDGGFGRLLGHIALANPQWRSAVPDVPALAIVHGPQAYISPSWYASKAEHGRTVPTWNYQSVHLTGPVAFHRDENWLLRVVTQYRSVSVRVVQAARCAGFLVAGARRRRRGCRTGGAPA